MSRTSILDANPNQTPTQVRNRVSGAVSRSHTPACVSDQIRSFWRFSFSWSAEKAHRMGRGANMHVRSCSPESHKSRLFAECSFLSKQGDGFAWKVCLPFHEVIGEVFTTDNRAMFVCSCLQFDVRSLDQRICHWNRTCKQTRKEPPPQKWNPIPKTNDHQQNVNPSKPLKSRIVLDQVIASSQSQASIIYHQYQGMNNFVRNAQRLFPWCLTWTITFSQRRTEDTLTIPNLQERLSLGVRRRIGQSAVINSHL